MEVVFAPGQIMRTDYFGSDDCFAGLAWLAVRGGEWHVLLPKHCGALPGVAYARPVTDRQEPNGWRWRLEIGTSHLPIKHRQIFGPPPELPAPGSKADCVVILYVRRENHAHRHENRRTPVIPLLETRLPLMVVRKGIFPHAHVRSHRLAPRRIDKPESGNDLSRLPSPPRG